MALVSVIWGVALLAVIATSFLSAGNVSYRLARNVAERARTDAIAEAAVSRAVLALLDPRPDSRWRADGAAQQFRFEGAQVTLRIQDELGRIDLNHADGALLAGLFRSAGLDAAAAGSLADKVLDWRDASPLKRLDGAKDADYRAAGRDYRPRNGPFQSVDELRLVLGMTPQLFERVAPALTVYSGKQFIDPQVAPREALSALPTMNTESIASLLAARTQGNAADSPSASASLIHGRAFSIRAEIEQASGASAREAVVRLTGDPGKPFWLLSWKSK